QSVSRSALSVSRSRHCNHQRIFYLNRARSKRSAGNSTSTASQGCGHSKITARLKNFGSFPSAIALIFSVQKSWRNVLTQRFSKKEVPRCQRMDDATSLEAKCVQKFYF